MAGGRRLVWRVALRVAHPERWGRAAEGSASSSSGLEAQAALLRADGQGGAEKAGSGKAPVPLTGSASLAWQ